MTIEDKLGEVILMSKYLRGRKPNPLRLKSFPNAIKDIQAIITTETNKARIEEAELIGRYFSTGGVPEFIDARRAALQKEHK